MRVQELNRVAFFAALMMILAWLPPIPLPFSPVPITFQVIGALLSGAILGARLGAISQVVYLLLGLVGLPVFSGGTAGIGVLAGPTGGYLIGFVFASATLGFCLSKSRFPEITTYIVAMPLALMTIYLPGTLQLSAYLGIDFATAAGIGTLPYIPLDIMKATIVTALAIPLKRRLKVSL